MGKQALVQCRIEARQKIDEYVEKREITKKQAMEDLAGETGVPFSTLRHWYYTDEESKSTNIHTRQTTDNSGKTRARVAKKIIKNLSKAAKLDSEDIRDVAIQQATELGAGHLGPEIYEMFRAALSRVEEIISANETVESPNNPEVFYQDLLRVARNAGWTEEEQYCSKCEIVVTKCPNRMCENYTGGK
jgi:hypothetical protein